MAKLSDEDVARGVTLKDGVKYAKGVEPAAAGPVDPDILKALEKPGKERISIFLDEDLLAAVKLHAKRKGEKYQTLINATLRNVFLDAAQRILDQGEPNEFIVKRAFEEVKKKQAESNKRIARIEARIQEVLGKPAKAARAKAKKAAGKR